MVWQKKSGIVKAFDMLSVSEIFRSIQGESTFTGLPCVFIRLAGCNLSCIYCDSIYARDEPGTNLEVEEVLEQVMSLGGQLVQVTGGEPLFQLATPQLIEALAAKGKTVLVETNGSILLAEDRDYHVIMDMKCPSSGAYCSHHERNPEILSKLDEVKFVIGTREDFDWAISQVKKYKFIQRGIPVLISPVHAQCPQATLADWVLNSGLQLRLQLQLHKVIWPGEERGR